MGLGGQCLGLAERSRPGPAPPAGSVGAGGGGRRPCGRGRGAARCGTRQPTLLLPVPEGPPAFHVAIRAGESAGELKQVLLFLENILPPPLQRIEALARESEYHDEVLIAQVALKPRGVQTGRSRKALQPFIGHVAWGRLVGGRGYTN